MRKQWMMVILVLIMLSGCGQTGGKALKETTERSGNSIAVVVDKPTADSKGEVPEVPVPVMNKSAADTLGGRVICIDPGHQEKADGKKEAIAPSSKVLKEKTSGGTAGIRTGVPEYQLNLEVAVILKRLLEEKGAAVVMTRVSNGVDLGNIDRAQIANDAGADLSVRIHADGSDNRNVRGVSVLYPGNQYIHNTALLQASKQAAEDILEGIRSAAKVTSAKTVERNDLTGFNWSKVPVVLVEMGFMTNPEEDELLGTPDYQEKMAEGILKGIEEYFQKQ